MRGLASRFAGKVFIACIVAGLALSAVGCSAGARTFQLTFPAEHEQIAIDALPVSLTDTSGLVVGFHPAPPGAWNTGVAALPEDKSALVITWVGGACDSHVSLTTQGTASALQVAIQTSTSGGCRLLGVGRSVELALNGVVHSENVSLSGR